MSHEHEHHHPHHHESAEEQKLEKEVEELKEELEKKEAPPVASTPTPVTAQELSANANSASPGANPGMCGTFISVLPCCRYRSIPSTRTALPPDRRQRQPGPRDGRRAARPGRAHPTKRPWTLRRWCARL